MTHILDSYIDANNRILTFDITEDKFKADILTGMDLARERIATIKAETNPDFDNIITALETCGDEMDMVASIFYNLSGTMTNDARQALAQELGPIMSAFGNELTLDPQLFAQVDKVYQKRADYTLSAEEATLLDNTWISFVRNGANLNDGDQTKLKEIDEKLSTLGPKYGENILKSTNAYVLWLDEDQVKGLPETALAQAKETAVEKGGKQPYAITLHYPSYGPAMTYLDDRGVRETLWRAMSDVAFKGKHDNSQNVLDIVKLRQERAKLLGFKSHADYILSRRMAGSVERVREFQKDMADIATPRAKEELKELKDFAKNLGDALDELKPWDTGYYAEKLRQEKFAFSDEDLRPYFPLQKVLDGTFKHFEKLFNVSFEPQPKLAVWHKDVDAYIVRDKDDDSELGILYTDFFPRESKGSGAWQAALLRAGLFRDKIARPIIATVYNFTKPTKNKPSLLTHHEVETIFHEFGHAMHNLLAKSKHQSLAGTSVYRDFVELPSQVQENWLMEPETLALVSGHVDTGEPLPQELIKKLKAASTFQSGLFYHRQLTLSTLDVEWHAQDVSKVSDVLAFELEVTKGFKLMEYVAGCTSVRFGHIFDGGYSAGYYGYMWAEVLDADAYEYFKEEGIYNKALAKKYRETILEKGGSQDPMKLYIDFRGREPSVEPMLRRKGLLADDKAA